MSRQGDDSHCLRCGLNVDSVICPRCGVLTEPGHLRQQRRRFANAATAASEPPVYTLRLKLVRDGGVDVEAS